MKRKVNLVGPNTLTVSLPSKWAKDHGIKKGQEIEVIEEGDSLRLGFVQSKQKSDKYSLKIDSGNHSYLRALISNAYKKGHDEIELHYEEDILSEIYKITSTLLGLEILEADSKHCIIKNVASGLDSELDNLLRKAFIHTDENSKRTLDAVIKNEFSDYASIDQVRFIITKYSDFCKRLLNKFHRNDENLLFKYMIVQILEKISNQYAYIYRFGHETKPKKFGKECLKYFKETNEIFEMFFHAYYSKDKSNIKEINLRKDKLLFETLYEIRQKLTPDDIVVIHHLSTIIRKCVDLTGPFFAVHN